MDSCYFSAQPGMPDPMLAMTPPPDYLEQSEPGPILELPTGQPETPDSLPSALHEKPPRMHLTIPQNQESRPGSRRRSSSSLSGSDQMFSARLPKGIANERAYLELGLMTQCWKKLCVYQEYAATEAKLQTVETAQQRRSLRKRLSALRSRRYSIENQEKALESGLCTLRIEMRNTLAWNLAWRSQSCCPSPVWDPPRPDTPLDATSPPFVPRWGFFSDWKDGGKLEKVDETGEESGNECNGAQFDGGMGQESEECVSPSAQVPSMPDTDEEIQEPSRRRSFDDEPLSLAERRLSLPYIPSEWI